MKQFLRIAIVIVLMVCIGIGTYVLFFKPANEETVYLMLSEIDEKEKTLRYADGLSRINKKNFDPSLVLEEDYTPEIKEKYNDLMDQYSNLLEQDGIRRIGLNYAEGENLETASFFTESGDFDVVQYSYPDLKLMMDDVFDYYFAYSQAVTKKISKSQIKSINKALKGYEEAMADLVDSFDSLSSLQSYVKANKSQDYSQELANRYKVVIVKYRALINNYASLIDNLKMFVTKYVFGGEMIHDKDSLMYDLMIKSLSKATSGEYSYEKLDARKVADDYMNSATNIVRLAMAESKDAVLGEIYQCEEGSVVCNNELYEQLYFTYNRLDLQLRVAKDGDGVDTLYIGDTDIEFLKSGNGFKIENGDAVITFTTSDGGTIDETIDIVNNKLTLPIYVDGTLSNNIYFYSSDDANKVGGNNYVHLIAKRWVVIPNVFVDGKIGFGAEENRVYYDTVAEKVAYYNIPKADKTPVYYAVEKVDGSYIVFLLNGKKDIRLTNAKYCDKTYYNKNELGDAINYKQMLSAYNKIVSDSEDNITKILDFSTKEKTAFVNDVSLDGVNYRTEFFVETIHDDIEYLLAGLGFIGEV